MGLEEVLHRVQIDKLRRVQRAAIVPSGLSADADHGIGNSAVDAG